MATGATTTNSRRNGNKQKQEQQKTATIINRTNLLVRNRKVILNHRFLLPLFHKPLPVSPKKEAEDKKLD